MSLLITWSEPELCTYDGNMNKSWFVYFDLTNDLTGETIRKQFRGGINSIHTKEERLEQGNALLRYWQQRLKSGSYNPWKKPEEHNPVEIPETVGDALAKILALKEKALRRKSFRNYRNVHDMLLAWMKRFHYQKLRLYQFTPTMAQAYLDFLLLEKEYAGKTHNNQMDILRALFSAMMVKGRRWITTNPFAGIEALPEDQGDNIPYSEAERVDVTQYMRQNDKRMFFAINFLFHSYIRKTELTTIRVGDIDFVNKTIKINSQAAKNRIQDSVTIPDAFLPVLLEMGLDLAPKHYYVFGKRMETSDRRMTRPDDISDRYLEHKKEMGFTAGDGKTFYSWKHTGVIAYYNVIKDPYALMRQLRHSELKTTMIYLRSLGLNPNFQFRQAHVSL